MLNDQFTQKINIINTLAQECVCVNNIKPLSAQAAHIFQETFQNGFASGGELMQGIMTTTLFRK